MKDFVESDWNNAEGTPNRALGESPDERLFDLLVDGELSTEEQRELFARLDARPEGWRRCALAFVEAQAWRSDLRPMTAVSVKDLSPAPSPVESPAKTTPEEVPATPAHPARAFRLPGWTQAALTLAASVLCAFFLGLEARRQWPATDATRNIAVVPDVPRVADKAPSPADNQATLVSQNELVGALTLGRTPQESVEVPVFRGPEYEQWVRDQPSAIPEDVRRAMEASGHHVEVERRFVPLTLEDGRQVIVSVEDVEVRPANSRFQ